MEISSSTTPPAVQPPPIVIYKSQRNGQSLKPTTAAWDTSSALLLAAATTQTASVETHPLTIPRSIRHALNLIKNIAAMLPLWRTNERPPDPQSTKQTKSCQSRPPESHKPNASGSIATVAKRPAAIAGQIKQLANPAKPAGAGTFLSLDAIRLKNRPQRLHRRKPRANANEPVLRICRK